MKKFFSMAMVAVALVMGFASCEKKDNTIVATDLKVSESVEVAVGQTVQIVATTTPEGAKIAWASKNEKIATVDANGLVTGVAKGETYVTAVSGDKAEMCKVIVKADMSKVSLSVTFSDLTATGVVIKAVCSDEEVPFYLSILDEKSYNEAESGAYASYGIDDVKGYVQYMLQYYADAYAAYGYTAADLCYYGSVEGDVDLDPSTKYYAVAYAVDLENVELLDHPTGSVSFTTPDIALSENVITMTYANGNISIATTNNDPYFFIFESKADYDQYQADLTAESVAAEVADWAATAKKYSLESSFTFTGAQTIDANVFWTTYMSETDLEAGDYIALAAPYAGAVNGAAAYCLFTYEAPIAAPARGEKAYELVGKFQRPAFRNYMIRK